MKFNKIAIILSLSVFIFACSSDKSELIEETQLYNSFVIESMEHITSTLQLPTALTTSQNTYAQKTVKKYQDITTIFSAVVALLKESTTSSFMNLTPKSGLYYWVSNELYPNSLVEVELMITEESDRYAFILTLKEAQQSIDLIRGYTLKNENTGAFFLEDPAHYLEWHDSHQKNIVLSMTTAVSRCMLTQNKNENSGQIEEFAGPNYFATYSWSSNGSGIVNYENGDRFSW